MDLFAILFFLGILAVIVVGVGLVIPHQNKKLFEKYSQLANMMGLEVENAPGTGFMADKYYPILRGEVAEMEVKLRTFKTGSGKSARYWTELSLHTGYQGKETLKISGNNVFKRIGKAFGSQDVEVGDREFDDYFIIKASEAGVAHHLLSPTIRQELMSVWKQNYVSGHIQLEEGTLVFKDENMILGMQKRAKLSRMLDVFVLIGTEIRNHGGQSGLSQQIEGDVFG